METYLSATPFGRRSLTLAQVAGQVAAKARPPEKAVHKWNVFRAICAARTRLGISERALAVLDALLSFHPETVLTGDGLIVFPSNAQLSLRAHGMPFSTLRRHLAALVDAGLIVRRDSPNGKRYARKSRAGDIELAFGFDFAPLVARAHEFDALAEEIRMEERALKLVKERITICRRDIAKMIATGMEEGLPIITIGCPDAANWADLHELYRKIISQIPRTAAKEILEPIAAELSALAEKLLSLLEKHVKTQNMDANESQTERHIQNSKPNPPIELELGFPTKPWAKVEPNPESKRPPEGTFPLGMVLSACPDIVDYARDGISSWRDFLAVAQVVRPMLGVSPSAWEEARNTMGEVQAAIVVAGILQKGAAITSPGGYLRELTRKAVVGEFSLGPMLMALIGTRKKEKKRA